jgi:DNA-binding MarR family transcriptional regulator
MSSPCACSGVRRASRALTRLYDEALAPAGLTTTQFAVLRTLERLGPSSVTALAHATGHERSAMTRNLGPLARAKLVEIAPAADPRSRAVSLTADGVAAIRRAEPGWESVQARVAAELGDDSSRLLALLARVEAIGNSQETAP